MSFFGLNAIEILFDNPSVTGRNIVVIDNVLGGTLSGSYGVLVVRRGVEVALLIV